MHYLVIIINIICMISRLPTNGSLITLWVMGRSIELLQRLSTDESPGSNEWSRETRISKYSINRFPEGTRSHVRMDIVRGCA